MARPGGVETKPVEDDPGRVRRSNPVIRRHRLALRSSVPSRLWAGRGSARSFIAIVKWIRRNRGTIIAGMNAHGRVVIARVPGPSVKTRNGVPWADRTPRETATIRSTAPKRFHRPSATLHPACSATPLPAIAASGSAAAPVIMSPQAAIGANGAESRPAAARREEEEPCEARRIQADKGLQGHRQERGAKAREDEPAPEERKKHRREGQQGRWHRTHCARSEAPECGHGRDEHGPGDGSGQQGEPSPTSHRREPDQGSDDDSIDRGAGDCSQDVKHDDPPVRRDVAQEVTAVVKFATAAPILAGESSWTTCVPATALPAGSAILGRAPRRERSYGIGSLIILSDLSLREFCSSIIRSLKYNMIIIIFKFASER